MKDQIKSRPLPLFSLSKSLHRFCERKRKPTSVLGIRMTELRVKNGKFCVLTVHEHKSIVDYVAKTAIISESTMNNVELIKDFIYCQLTI